MLRPFTPIGGGARELLTRRAHCIVSGESVVGYISGQMHQVTVKKVGIQNEKT
jgi:hypothetical protein